MIDGLTYFAWAVMAIILVILTVLIVFLGSLPKKIADKHNHPQADAINAASWLGLFLGGIGWPFALVWAYTRSGSMGHGQTADGKEPSDGSSCKPSAPSATKKAIEKVDDKPASQQS